MSQQNKDKQPQQQEKADNKSLNEQIAVLKGKTPVVRNTLPPPDPRPKRDKE